MSEVTDLAEAEALKAEAESPDEPTPEPTPDEQDEEAEAQESEQVEGVPAEPDDSSLEAQRREQQKAAKKILAANTAHAKRLGDVLGEEATTLLACPRCTHESLPFGGIMGFIIPPSIAPVPAEVKRDVLVSVGEVPEEVTALSAWSRECEKCGGMGRVLSGSRLNAYRTINCLACQGKGYVAVGPELAGAQAQAAAQVEGNGTAERVEQPPDLDPWQREPTDPNYGKLPQYVGV